MSQYPDRNPDDDSEYYQEPNHEPSTEPYQEPYPESYPESYLNLDEPLPDHLADTGPVRSIRDAGRRSQPATGRQRLTGLILLVGASAFTFAAILIMLSPSSSSGLPDNPAVPTRAGQEEPLPTQQPTQQVQVVSDSQTVPLPALPTLDPQLIASILSEPVDSQPVFNYGDAVRNIYNPFTIIPERTRSSVEEYTIVSGDTIFSIAERYGLAPETIVWGNDHTIVDGLRPGRVINILPVNGVYYQTQTDDETVAELAQRFQVDPYTIIDSEFNDLFTVGPDDPLPPGTRIVVPGGVRESITWNPVVQRVAANSPGAAGSISFAPGEPGSCGLVSNPGGSAWVSPLAGYTWIRGFSGVHSGVDLSAPSGTPVRAANGGAVIYAGWSNWGYGYTVVLASGPYTTLYGHLSAINVGCAQYAAAGDIIGAVGTSGNSSGPHLHFEIRYQDVPQDPTYTLPF